MNSIHNNGENDKSLSDGLDKLSQDYALLEQDEPPELLDQAILNSAHRAVEKKPHWMKFGWLHGLTTAAIFVLAFSIILNQREPVPTYEIGARNNELIRLQREQSAKKQSDSFSEQRQKAPGLKKEVIIERQPDTLQSSPAAAAPVSAATVNAPEERAEEPIVEAQPSLYVRDDLQSNDGRSDKDIPIRESVAEEEPVDEADSMADSPEASALSGVASPVAVGETTASEVKARVGTDSEMEQKLLAIIKLKQSGDETWKTELESFKESYPDYPLPDELKH